MEFDCDEFCYGSSIKWHSVETFDVATKTDGSFRTMQCPVELTHFANAGLDIVVKLLESIKEEFPILSYADFYQVRFAITCSFLLLFL